MVSNRFMTMKSRISKLFIILFGAIILLIGGCYVLVLSYSRGRVYDSVDEIPHRSYGLLLGTSPITPWGGHNYYFDRRIDATVNLFNNKKIDKIIASGGDYRSQGEYGCDELASMRDSLVKRGVPVDAIILDYQGTRTRNSIIKTREITDSVTIISQKYHNERALYIADHYSLNAIAYNAKMPQTLKFKVKNLARESLARVKMLWELATD